VSRDEFSAKTKDQAYARSNGFCENKACGAKLQTGKFTYDHILPCAFGGEGTLVNCQVICQSCDDAKTYKGDIPAIRKSDRQRRNHIDANVEPRSKIQSRGFPQSEKAAKREPRLSLPPLALFKERT
jgi:5-methylcytosine-specific restriction endonuclease McrA